MGMKAQKALEKTRQTMADSKKEERASLKAASSKKNSAHMKMLGNVTISDNILKALKSLPASSRRGLENEIRMQLMNEQKELQQLTQQLSQNHLTIAKQQQMLAASKEEYEKKANKMKENLESERRAMQQQIDSIATMRKDVLSKQKQSQAEIERQRRELEAERKRLMKTQEKFKSRQQRLSQEFSSIASMLVAKQQEQRGID